MKKVYAFIFLSWTAVMANAQDLTGIWRGHFRSNNSYERLIGDDDRYKFEVQIAERGKGFEAVTYSYKTTVFYGKAEAEGTFNSSTKKALLRELKIVEVRMAGGDACVMTCFLQYSKLGDEEFLEGTYTSMNTRDSSSCGKGSIFLHKVPASDFNKEPFLEKREKEIEREKHKISVAPPAPPIKKSTVTRPVPASGSSSKKPNTVAKTSPPKTKTPGHNNPKPVPRTALAKTDVLKQNPAPVIVDSSHKIEKKLAPVLVVPRVLTNRQNELVRTITVNTNEIELRIYDDGTIDHDTVSVYVDNKNVINHAMLTDQPIIVKLHLDDDNDYHEVVMVAENEGEIPPNTSLMVVKAGDKEYEVRIVSTEQKNATVVFKFEKNK